MSWSSLHLDHAVERVRFEVHFSEPLPKKSIDGLGLMFDAMTDLRFGQREDRQITNFMIGPNGQPIINSQTGQSQSGWTSARVATKHNLPLEMLALDPTSLIYESSDYKGWEKATSRFDSVCRGLLDQAGTLVNAKLVVHDYVDRFLYHGNPRSADPRGVIEPSYLVQMPEGVLVGRDLWHIHRGWFEDVDGDLFLINQNCDVQEVSTPVNNQVRSLQIYTKTEFRPSVNGIEMALVSARFEQMHRRCNSLVAAMLNKAMAEKVGLKKVDVVNV